MKHTIEETSFKIILAGKTIKQTTTNKPHHNSIELMSRIARNSALLYTKSSVRICSLQVSALTMLRGLKNKPVANDFGSFYW